MNYGTRKKTSTIDDDGSTKTVVDRIHEGKVTKTYTQYEVRVRVKTQAEELAEIVRFRKDIPTKNRISIHLEETNTSKDKGYYYLVKCWEEAN